MKLAGSVIVFCACISVTVTNSRAQADLDASVLAWQEYFDRSYGNDYNLVNGIRYLRIPARADGHPFLGEDRFSTGRIVIDEKEYRPTELKYDICNQQIILNYRHFSGSEQQIVLISENINEFELGNRLFRKVDQPGKGPRYFQVIEGDPVSCLYYWQKELVKGSSGEYYYKYLPETRGAFLWFNGEFHPFRGKRSFIQAFPEQYQKEIKDFLKSGYPRFSETSDRDMQRALQFCNALIRSGK